MKKERRENVLTSYKTRENTNMHDMKRERKENTYEKRTKTKHNKLTRILKEQTMIKTCLKHQKILQLSLQTCCYH
jgi:hypothetical protein